LIFALAPHLLKLQARSLTNGLLAPIERERDNSSDSGESKMERKIRMIWKAGTNLPAYGLNARDRVVELMDGRCLVLRSVDQSETGFVLTSLGGDYVTDLRDLGDPYRKGVVH
jgi:hypothetical protein